jgi:hypothetical protein
MYLHACALAHRLSRHYRAWCVGALALEPWLALRKQGCSALLGAGHCSGHVSALGAGGRIARRLGRAHPNVFRCASCVHAHVRLRTIFLGTTLPACWGAGSRGPGLRCACRRARRCQALGHRSGRVSALGADTRVA